MIMGYRAVCAILCVVALYLDSGLFTEGVFRQDMFTFYTILSNVLVLIYFIVALTPASKCQWFRGGCGIAIAFTLVVYNAIIVPVGVRTGQLGYVPYNLPDCMVHIVIPSLMILDALLLAERGSYKWYYPLTWLVFPILYFVYIMPRGELLGIYPYFFLDFRVIGVSKFLAFVIGGSVGYLAFGYLMVLWNKYIGRRLRIGEYR